jgi:cell division cycle protein 20 (cofactor of APC complex)
LKDDFYVNLLDWGRRNILGVALGPSVYLWNGKDGSVEELMSLQPSSPSLGEDPYIASLRWIHDGSSVGLGTSSGQVQIWDVAARKKIRTIMASEGGHRIGSLAWNKHLLSTGSRDGVVQTFDVRLPRPLIMLHASQQRQEVCGLEWSPDGQQLASGSNDNLVHVWDRESATPRHVFAEHKAAVKALAWCPWKPGLLATGGGSADRTIRTWSTVTGECLSSVNANASVSSLVWSRTSRELVSAHGHPTSHVRFWQQQPSSTSACHLRMAADIEEAHAGRILHMALSPDGQTLVTAGADESIKFWAAFGDDASAMVGKQRKGKAIPSETGYVLMPTFSRSAAVTKALNRANQGTHIC